MRYELEKIQDEIILNALFKNDNIIKNAGLGIKEDLYGLVDHLKGELFKSFDKDRPVASFINFIGPGLLLCLGWKGMVLGLVWQIAEVGFGVNFTSMFAAIGDKIKEALLGRGSISHEEVNEIADEAVAQNVKTAKKISSDIIKIAIENATFKDKLEDAKIFNKIILECKNNNDISKFNGFFKTAIGGSGFAGILGTILKFILKGLLYSVGLLGVAKVVTNLAGGEDKRDPKQQTVMQPSDKDTKQKINQLSKKPHSLKPGPEASNYEQNHYNDNYNVWMESNHFSNVKDQLIDWALKIYPELSAKKDKISSSADFNKVLNIFLTENSMTNNTIVIPTGFFSIKDIVDHFAGDIQ